MVLDYGQMGIHARKEFVILGLDPGRDKIGFAFVDSDGGLRASGMFPSSESSKFFLAVKSDREALREFIIEGGLDALPEDIAGSVNFIAIGNGTHSAEFTERVRESLSAEILTVDERNTTLEARSLYWKIHRPGLLMRLIPEGLRVPARVLDDLAAWAIALRAVKKYRDMSQNKL